MSLVTAHNLSKFYGPDEIFSGLSLEIPHGARIALVGPNGAGKTTLLNLLTGRDTPNEGTITVAKSTRIGFLPQRPELVGEHTLWEEQLNAFADLRRMEAELHSLLEKAAADDSVMARYGDLEHRFQELGGYTYETRVKTVLQGVGFSEGDYHRPLPKLSGGQKTRALLARLLLEEPDLLVLDEPTNHLDIEAVEWLEYFLSNFPGAVLAVSHDRYFMDAVAKNIWELDFGLLETYRGNYSHYLRQREERRERLLKEYEAQREFIAKEEDYIRRNIAGQNTRQAKGRLKRLERLKREGGLVHRPRERHNMHLRMNAALRSGDKVLMTSHLAVGYPDAPAPLFNAPDITLYRGEIAALIGPNGAGKSTFLKTVLGQLEPLAGEVRIGAAVQIGYFAQAHELLNPKNSILDEIQTIKPMPVSETRNYLGQFLFQGDDVFRPISTLSGGERGRVALAKLALSGANFLMLDEPTNHLDIDSQEILQAVLDNFSGTILLVSHDRYLIDALATQIWAVQPGKLTVYKGTYQEYVAAREKEKAAANTPAAPKANNQAPSAKSQPKKNGLNEHQLKKQIAEIEAHIHHLETRLETLTSEIEQASAQGNAAKVRELGEAYTQAEADLEKAMENWEVLQT
jgi:ATP-binding cassette, subfamily F, member 3